MGRAVKNTVFWPFVQSVLLKLVSLGYRSYPVDIEVLIRRDGTPMLCEVNSRLANIVCHYDELPGPGVCADLACWDVVTARKRAAEILGPDLYDVFCMDVNLSGYRAGPMRELFDLEHIEELKARGEARLYSHYEPNAIVPPEKCIGINGSYKWTYLGFVDRDWDSVMERLRRYKRRIESSRPWAKYPLRYTDNVASRVPHL